MAHVISTVDQGARQRGVRMKAPSRPKAAPTFPDDDTSVVASLSVRARHVLENNLVASLSAFMALTPEQLLKFRNCGKKTLAEFIELQSRLRPKQPAALPPPIVDPISFDSSPAEVFDTIRSALSVRAKRVLVHQKIVNLQCFMQIERDRLLRWRNCGKTTAGEIVRMQSGIAAFARAHCCCGGVFNPAKLVEAPCLAGFEGEAELAPLEGDVYPDVDNPAPWLASWVQGVASSERYARIFMLRMGMLGSAPLTLEDVAMQSGGVTRERVRQIQVKVAKKAGTRYQQLRLRPLAEATAQVVNKEGGMIGLEELTQAVLCRGRDGGQLKYATGLMAFFADLQVWQDAGVRLRLDRTVCNMSRVNEPLHGRAVGRSSTQTRLRFPPTPRLQTRQFYFDPNDMTI